MPHSLGCYDMEAGDGKRITVHSDGRTAYQRRWSKHARHNLLCECAITSLLRAPEPDRDRSTIDPSWHDRLE